MNFEISKEKFSVIILVAFILITHFAFLAYPAQVVFDEVHFGTFANSYFTHEYYFDIHPPLGKLIIAGFAKLMGLETGFNFQHIADSYDAWYLFVLRFLPALFGSLIPLILYALLKKAGLSAKAAFLGAFLAAADTALLTQSKFILLDSLLLCFGVASLHFFLCSESERSTKRSFLFWTLSILFATAALSIKWTGLSFFGIIVLLMFFKIAKTLYVKFIKKIPIHMEALKILAAKLLLLLIISSAAYYAIFWVHFNILYKSGSGDAYMSESFRQGEMSSFAKFVDLNKAMYYYNSTLQATHPYSSKWYEWPFDRRPIGYWVANQGNLAASIYLVGNPIVWWSVLIAVISAVLISFSRFRRSLPGFFWICLLGYFANLLPYVLISRSSFLYHYLPSLIFGILILAIIYEKIVSPLLVKYFSEQKEHLAYYSFLLLTLMIFMILSPISFGFFIPYQASKHYMDFVRFLF